jgi:hypothetical protein
MTQRTLEHGSGFPEVHGVGTASLYGLLMPTHLPIRVNDQVKIVWRMTGSGPIRLWATSPTGRRLGLAWGPDLHSGSNYHRPGQEWGAGYRFPRAGCWQLHARRTVGRAVVALPVVAR